MFAKFTTTPFFLKKIFTTVFCLLFALTMMAQDSLTAVRDTTSINTDSIDVIREPVMPERHKINFFDAELVKRDGKYVVEVLALDDEHGLQNKKVTGLYDFSVDKWDNKQVLNFTEGRAKLGEYDTPPKLVYLRHDTGEKMTEDMIRFEVKDNKVKKSSIPFWLSILPPLLAIILALVFREVLVSLFMGIWLGAFIINGYSLEGLVTSFLNVIDKYVIGALADTSHIAVIVFSLLIGGMVAIVSRNGGMAGVVNSLSGFAKGARSSQFATWLMGIAIFFDDYANTLVVGNTMRPLTDKFRISREKLAYLVDSTAAPIAAIAFITTWIGAELGYIQEAIDSLQLSQSAYSVFLNSLQYSFYPILTMLFILMLILFKRDFGPMLRAERRARSTGMVSSESMEEVKEDMGHFTPMKGVPQRASNALLPVLTVIGVTILGLLITGGAFSDGWSGDGSFFTKLSNVIGNSDSYAALLWSSLAGVAVAVILTLLGRHLSLEQTMDSFAFGVKTMIPAIAILVLAWSLATITKELHTAEFLTSLLQGNIDPNWLPVLTFLLAGAIAFSTGSSWSTMAILYPIILPTTWLVCQSAGYVEAVTLPIFYSVTSSVLAGSVFGDHCSPISDTTILSSLASQCNHIDHVRTQLPYALTVATVSVGLGWASIVFDMPMWMSFGIGLGVLLLVVLALGRTVHDKEWYEAQEEEFAEKVEHVVDEQLDKVADVTHIEKEKTIKEAYIEREKELKKIEEEVREEQAEHIRKNKPEPLDDDEAWE